MFGLKRRSSLLLRRGSLYTPSGLLEADLRIQGEVISEIGASLPSRPGEIALDLKNILVFPGLINSHDHLEFGLFPNLGQGPYRNYMDWGRDIWSAHRQTIEEILQVPLSDRLLWSGYRNLLCGVTTVVHHNPYRSLFGRNYPVRVLRDYHWAHSLGQEPDFRQPRGGRPFIIHLAEGNDTMASAELRRLCERGAMTPDTVIVHGIAIPEEDMPLVREGASLVWCPSSNHFLFGRTANVPRLRNQFRVVLGSDSPLTCAGDFLDEMRMARRLGMVSDDDLWEMVSRTPASVFRLPNLGGIAVGKSADLLFIGKTHDSPLENLFSAKTGDICLVLKAGRPMLGDEKFENLFSAMGDSYDATDFDGRRKLIYGDYNGLLKRIAARLPKWRCGVAAPTLA